MPHYRGDIKEDKEFIVVMNAVKLVKKTRTGIMHESDAVLFQRVLQFYNQHHHTTEPSKSTYPSQEIVQQD